MKELIDFDRQFNEYMDTWAEKLLKKGKKAEEIESLIPEAYQKWAKEAAKYFDDMGPEELVQMLGAYMDEEIDVPDILSDKIAETPACERGVYEMFTEERSEEEKILLMNLLANMGSRLPLNDYIQIVCRNEEGELTEAAAEALKYVGGEATEAVLEAYDEEHDPLVKEKLMYVLVYSEPRPEGLTKRLIELMGETENLAVVAGMMAYYGDAQCLPALYLAEQAEGISYIDYVEICDAIESLGGETKREREFNGDDYYEMMHNGGFEA